MMVEIFCGILSGGAFGPFVRQWKDFERPANLVCLTIYTFTFRMIYRVNHENTEKLKKASHLVAVPTVRCDFPFDLFGFECFFCYVWIFDFLCFG